MTHARYEGAEIEGALHVVRRGDKVLELGAGLGLVGAVVARNARPSHVFAFEANPDLIKPCNWLYRINRLRRRISVQNQVLLSASRFPTRVPFYRHKHFRSSSLIPLEDQTESVVQVETACFNAFCRNHQPDVLIADIEGGELDLLCHADLSSFRAIVIEFHASRYGRIGLETCKAVLKDEGFQRIAKKSTARVWTMERRASV